MDNNNENTLYPIKFTPIIKNKIWGGTRLKDILNKDTNGNNNAGESWEISSYNDDISIVNNGFLKGNTILDLVEIYMGDLVGDSVYDKFGIDFPLLFKFIDADDYLSIQVHPDNNTAIGRHNSYGKTEMWYIVDAEENAEIIVGFNKNVTKSEYLEKVTSNQLPDILNFEKVKKDDAIFLPAGRIHSICPGILLAEIQQTSDLTYRIYDWGRVDSNGNSRELHTEFAIDTINFDDYKKQYKTEFNLQKNKSSEITNCEYFTVNVIDIDTEIERDYSTIDSFIVYMIIDGEIDITFSERKPPIKGKKGETVLIPAVLQQIFINPTSNKAKLLEVYIK
jgi:mannose-6-phosphate isomerase